MTGCEQLNTGINSRASSTSMNIDGGLRNSGHRYFKGECSKYFGRQNAEDIGYMGGTNDLLSSPNAKVKVTE